MTLWFCSELDDAAAYPARPGRELPDQGLDGSPEARDPPAVRRALVYRSSTGALAALPQSSAAFPRAAGVDRERGC
jgi:hypothetical protein